MSEYSDNQGPLFTDLLIRTKDSEVFELCAYYNHEESRFVGSLTSVPKKVAAVFKMCALRDKIKV